MELSSAQQYVEREEIMVDGFRDVDRQWWRGWWGLGGRCVVDRGVVNRGVVNRSVMNGGMVNGAMVNWAMVTNAVGVRSGATFIVFIVFCVLSFDFELAVIHFPRLS